MLNKIFTVVLCFLVLVSLWGCGTSDSKSESLVDVSVADTQASHSHNFLPATCFNPKTCSCGATEGEALGHHFNEATCSDAAICRRCGVKDGEPLGHRYTEATYDAPKTCQNCGKTVGDKLKLSDTCEQVLASGYYGDDYYEIVSNQFEDYSGLKFEVGVIKNNEWLLEPTSDMPFVTEENMFKENGPETGEVFYLGKGCFVSEKVYSSDFYMYIFYNAETGAFYSNSDYDLFDMDPIFSLIKSNKDDCLIISKSAIQGYDDDGNKYVRTDFTTLNKLDMTLAPISVYHDYEQAIMKGNISNGLFSVSFDVSNYPALYFYDLNGNMVIDLSEYKTGWQWPFFSNGECEIEIINNNDTEYIITIDKEGNVLDSVKKTD